MDEKKYKEVMERLKKRYPSKSSLNLSNPSGFKEFIRELSEANEPEIEEIERQERESLKHMFTTIVHN